MYFGLMSCIAQVYKAGHVGSAWRRRGPEGVDFLFRMMDEAIEPTEILSSDEEEWLLWFEKKGSDPHVPEPACATKDLLKTQTSFGEKNHRMKITKSKVHIPKTTGRTWTGDPTEGPTELQGHPWRKPMSANPSCDGK